MILKEMMTNHKMIVDNLLITTLVKGYAKGINSICHPSNHIISYHII